MQLSILSAIGFGTQMISFLYIKGVILCLYGRLQHEKYKVQHLLISYLHESLASNVQCLEAILSIRRRTLNERASGREWDHLMFIHKTKWEKSTIRHQINQKRIAFEQVWYSTLIDGSNLEWFAWNTHTHSINTIYQIQSYTKHPYKAQPQAIDRVCVVSVSVLLFDFGINCALIAWKIEFRH